MQNYRHILFASDLSPASRRAGQRAAALARLVQARVTALHAVDYFPEDLPTDWIWPEDVDPQRYLGERADGALAEQLQGLQLEAAERVVHFSRHSAHHEIVRTAREREVDLIVMGSHGRHGLGALLGATSDGVLHRASCDVLVVRAPS